MLCAHVYHSACITANLRSNPLLSFENVCPLKCHRATNADTWEEAARNQGDAHGDDETSTNGQLASVNTRRARSKAKAKAKAKATGQGLIVMPSSTAARRGSGRSSTTRDASFGNNLDDLFAAAQTAATSFAAEERVLSPRFFYFISSFHFYFF